MDGWIFYHSQYDIIFSSQVATKKEEGLCPMQISVDVHSSTKTAQSQRIASMQKKMSLRSGGEGGDKKLLTPTRVAFPLTFLLLFELFLMDWPVNSIIVVLCNASASIFHIHWKCECSSCQQHFKAATGSHEMMQWLYGDIENCSIYIPPFGERV